MAAERQERGSHLLNRAAARQPVGLASAPLLARAGRGGGAVVSPTSEEGEMERTRTAGSSPSTDPREDDAERDPRYWILMWGEWHTRTCASYLHVVDPIRNARPCPPCSCREVRS